MGLGCAWALLGPVGCSDAPAPTSGSGSGSGSGSSGTWDSSSSTTAAADETGTSTTDPTGVVFLIVPDGGGIDMECDLFVQDCPPGEKCSSWSNDGGSAWNATKCVPIVDDPAGVGEPCHVEGSLLSGIDDCDGGSMCFFIDVQTAQGFCMPFCLGNESNPHCEHPNLHCALSSSGALSVCLPRCDPLKQYCALGQGCYPVGDAWDCIPDVSGEAGAYGDPCEHSNVCDPGLVCLGPAALPPGEACEGAVGCCSEICDLGDPAGDLQCAGAAGGQQCVPWYEPGEAIPGHARVGVCTVQ